MQAPRAAGGRAAAAAAARLPWPLQLLCAALSAPRSARRKPGQSIIQCFSLLVDEAGRLQFGSRSIEQS